MQLADQGAREKADYQSLGMSGAGSGTVDGMSTGGRNVDRPTAPAPPSSISSKHLEAHGLAPGAFMSSAGSSSSFAEVSSVDPSLWTIDQVSAWCARVNLSPEVAASLRENRVDGRALMSLTMDVMKGDLGIGSIGDRLSMQEAIRRLWMESHAGAAGSVGGGSVADPMELRRGDTVISGGYPEAPAGVLPPPAYDTTPRSSAA
ncbi:hypothetical protein HK101_006958 [Irineochytrium annulatum]|nr:hypothetical protein HK101_006958 [Irineochytrium annulatum]